MAAAGRVGSVGRNHQSGHRPQAADHEIPDAVGELVPWAARRRSDAAAVGAEHGRGVGVGAEDLVHAHLVDHDQVGAACGPAWRARSPRRRASPRRRPPGAVRGGGCAPSSAAMSGLVTSSMVGALPSSDFLILADGVVGRPEVGGRGGHHHHVGVGRGGHGRLRSSSVVPTRMRSTPAGSGSATFAAIRVTRAPRATAARANAYPCLPEERLPRNRTGSSGSRVPPAVTTTCRPARSASAPPRASARRATAKISAGSGSRPLPVSAPVSRPTRRLDHEHTAGAQRRDVGDRRRVLPHLGVHGRRHHHRTARRQQRVGQQVVGEAVRRLGQQVGGGGRDDDQVGLLPEAHVRHLVHVGPDVVGDRRPESAAQVGAPTKRSADAVGTTRTPWPDSVKRRSSSQAL